MFVLSSCGTLTYTGDFCEDGMMDRDETDIDCGGQYCKACAEEGGCNPVCTGDKPVCKEGVCVAEEGGCNPVCTGDKPVCKDGVCVAEEGGCNPVCTGDTPVCLDGVCVAEEGGCNPVCTGDTPVCLDGVCVAEEGGCNPICTGDTPVCLDGVCVAEGSVIDTDGDGVPDVDDMCPTGDDTLNADDDILPDACDNDDDNDTFADVIEQKAGTDQQDAASTPSKCSILDDCSGYGSEFVCFIDQCVVCTPPFIDNPINCDQGLACDTGICVRDSDRDGYADTVEIIEGTNPQDPSIYPEFT